MRLTLITLLCFGLFCCKAQPAQDEVYLYSFFTGNGEDGLHLIYSEDGYEWNYINNNKSLLTPQVGENKLMRDPCVTQTPDGTFHMVWTTSWTGKTVGYASSKDLINWSAQTAIPVMQNQQAENVWAPEINYIPETQEYLIYWSSTIVGKYPETDETYSNGKVLNHRIYCTKTKDFKSFTPSALYYEPGFSVIDASIVPTDSGYAMFVKDETQNPPAKNLMVATSTTVDGGWSTLSAPITSNEYWSEGPTACRVGEKWFMYFDKYRLKKVGLFTSKDLKTWTDESEQLHMPGVIRHGTVFKVQREILDKLLAL